MVDHLRGMMAFYVLIRLLGRPHPQPLSSEERGARQSPAAIGALVAQALPW